MRLAIGVEEVRVEGMLEGLVQQEGGGQVHEGDVCGGEELQVLPAEGVEDGVPGVGCGHLLRGCRGGKEIVVGEGWWWWNQRRAVFFAL